MEAMEATLLDLEEGWSGCREEDLVMPNAVPSLEPKRLLGAGRGAETELSGALRAGTMEVACLGAPWMLARLLRTLLEVRLAMA